MGVGNRRHSVIREMMILMRAKLANLRKLVGAVGLEPTVLYARLRIWTFRR